MKEYELLKGPNVNLEKISISPSPVLGDIYWCCEYRPWLLYKNVFFEDSLGVVFHFVIGDN